MNVLTPEGAPCETPPRNHWYVEIEPGVTLALAVKVMGGAPLHTVFGPVMFTEGIGFTVMFMALLVAGLLEAQLPTFDSNVQVTISPFTKVDVV